MYVGLVPPGRLETIAGTAAAYGISESRLMAVVHRLASLGYLETVRGKGGGLRLARAPAAINLGRVVRDLETDMALVECFGGGCCRIERACALRGRARRGAGRLPRGARPPHAGRPPRTPAGAHGTPRLRPAGGVRGGPAAGAHA